MLEKLISVYHALTVDDAQRLADKLKEQGVEAFVDSTDSPMYGASQGPSSRIVRVREPIAGFAREIVNAYKTEYHAGVPKDEWQREETGLELPVEQLPSEDDLTEPMGEGVERLSSDRPGPEAPEVEDLIYENRATPEEVEVDPSAGFVDPLVGFGPDRPMVEMPDVESESAEDQPIDQLDVRDGLDDPEIGTPSANLRGHEGKDREEAQKRAQEAVHEQKRKRRRPRAK